MPVFAIDFSATESDTGLVTFTDLSLWGAASDSNYDKANFVRQITLNDAFGVLIAILTFPTTSLTVTYQLTKNQWVVAKFDITGVANFTKTEKYGFQRLFEVAFINQIKVGCGCGCNNSSSPDMCAVDVFYDGANIAKPIGDGVGYQNNIDSAYALLTAQ